MMAKYEVALVKYPDIGYPDNLWWTAVCLAMRGCVSDGQTQEEALMMIADAMASYLEEGPGWKAKIFDAEQTQSEKEITLAESHEEGGITEIHWVEPRFMTEEEIRDNHRHLEPIESPTT
jgi:predicted RNase H-like HicB family nuclease